MTNHFFVIDPQGKTHTRSSKGRTYSHVVLRYTPPVTFEDQCKEIGWVVAQNSDGYWKSMKLRAETGVLDHLPDFDVERRVQEARDFIAENPSLELHMAQIGARALARFEAKVEGGEHYDRWHDMGWASRLDLAHKNASSTGGQVFEAQVGKPPKAVASKKEAA
jgi:hypothetical protein